MADFDAILTEYLAERERTGTTPDPRPYLARVAPEERAALRARIDATLRDTPRRRFDAAAFEASLSSPLMQSIATAATGSSGFWPALLPRLRNAARLKRSEVVDQLADALGVPERRDKVHRYYHEMEQGLLDPDGVSDTVLERLGAILGSTAQGLRDAGRSLGPGTQGPSTGAVFARTALPPTGEYAAPASPPSPAAADDEPLDEVDELFRGAHR
jgi:hypothetical protein